MAFAVPLAIQVTSTPPLPVTNSCSVRQAFSPIPSRTSFVFRPYVSSFLARKRSFVLSRPVSAPGLFEIVCKAEKDDSDTLVVKESGDVLTESKSHLESEDEDEPEVPVPTVALSAKERFPDNSIIKVLGDSNHWPAQPPEGATPLRGGRKGDVPGYDFMDIKVFFSKSISADDKIDPEAAWHRANAEDPDFPDPKGIRKYGFVTYAELLNGRVAMIAFFLTLLVEKLTGHGIQWWISAGNIGWGSSL